jgi:hypothetical protein
MLSSRATWACRSNVKNGPTWVDSPAELEPSVVVLDGGVRGRSREGGVSVRSYLKEARSWWRRPKRGGKPERER